MGQQHPPLSAEMPTAPGRDEIALFQAHLDQCEKCFGVPLVLCDEAQRLFSEVLKKVDPKGGEEHGTTPA